MKNSQRILSVLLALALLAGGFASAKAAPAAASTAYYVATSGSDSNSGSSAAPFKTISKGISVLSAGGTLTVQPGTYNEQISVTKSGSSGAPLTIIGTGAVIDMRNSGGSPLKVTGDYVTIKGFELKNSSTFCADTSGDYLVLDNLYVHDCSGHGIYTHDNAHIQILNSTVTRAVLSNSAMAISGGWDSAIKVRVSDDVLIQGNKLHHNYGEGVGSRGTNITIRGNVVYDNFSVNIYTNSENALIEKNLVYCTPNSGFERDGKPAAGIAMGEEYFDGWGARLKNARILNNIVAHCKSGVRYNGAEDGVVGGGLKYATIANNTLYDTVDSAIAIVYVSAQTGNLITNNIVWQANNKLVSVSGSGLTFKNNLWKVTPPSIAASSGDKIGAPGFVVSNPGDAAADFRLSSTSLALRAGASACSLVDDYFGTTRTSPYDIGAAQASGGSTAPSPTPTQVVLASPTIAPATTVAPTIAPTQSSSSTTSDTMYDNKNAAFSYSSGWKSVSSSSAVSGSYQQTSTNGASASLTFIGSSFSVIYKGGPSYRTMNVLVDGVKVGSINQQMSTSTYNLRWDYSGTLTEAKHTLKLAFASSKSTDLGSVDAVIVHSGSGSAGQVQPTATTAPAQPTPTAVVVYPTATPVTIDPTATAVIVDPTATPVTLDPTATPVTPAPSAETTLDDKDPAFVYSSGWQKVSSSQAYGKAYAQTSTNGASATLGFSGTSFSLIYKGGPSYRDMDVFVDGQKVATISQRFDVSTYNARWDFPGQLPAGQHTLKLVFVASSSSNNGSVDAVIVR